MLIEISETKAYRIELIKMEAKGPTYLSIRQLYATKKDPEFKPARGGMTIPVDIAPRIIKGMIKVFKNKKQKKPKLIEKRGKDD